MFVVQVNSPTVILGEYIANHPWSMPDHSQKLETYMGTEWYKQLLKETVRYIQVPTDQPPSRSAHSASSSPVCHSLDSDLTLIPRGDPHLAESQAGSG